LYKNHPFCIDFDANFCLLRSYSQLNPKSKTKYFKIVQGSIKKNIDAIEYYFHHTQPSKWYDDTHGLPGALAALVESNNIISDSKYKSWKNPFNKVWWL